MLQILADTEDAGAAGMRLWVDGGEKIFERRCGRAASGHGSGVPPKLESSPPRVARLFRDLGNEHHAALPSPLRGTLHMAAPHFSQSAEACDELLQQAATLIALVVRSLDAERATETNAPQIDVAQLQKLATIGQSASQIVHELNNPLTTIIAYSEFLTRRLRDRQTPAADVDRLLKINEAAVRIQRFCRQLTDYSRPAGSLQTPVDLREVLDSALSFCLHGLRSSNITIERVYQEIPPIGGVDAALTQVFVNLITNAWHAMPDGGALSLRTRSEHGLVMIEIADEGQGISTTDQHRIFEAYFTTKPRGSGVGLGLSIVQQIVNEHRGEIRAEAREPRGTVFVLSFPPQLD